MINQKCQHSAGTGARMLCCASHYLFGCWTMGKSGGPKEGAEAAPGVEDSRNSRKYLPSDEKAHKNFNNLHSPTSAYLPKVSPGRRNRRIGTLMKQLVSGGRKWSRKDLLFVYVWTKKLCALHLYSNLPTKRSMKYARSMSRHKAGAERKGDGVGVGRSLFSSFCCFSQHVL